MAPEQTQAEADNIQFNDAGKLKHFLTLDGLNKETLLSVLDTAENFTSVADKAIKKAPLLRGKTVANIFFENSTRTRTTFELAAKRLSADVLNINLVNSSTKKGESLLDTLRNLEAMQCDMFIVRHGDSGAAHFIASNVAPNINVINGGDGQHSHPTQGMLDMFTIRRAKGSFEGLTVAIIGDILHSRVARSDIRALRILGVEEIRVVAPKTLLPAYAEDMGVRIYSRVDEALKDVDVIMGLRLQNERMQGATIPSADEYYFTYGLTPERLKLAKPDAIVMHPGPTNRGVEIEGSVADGAQSVILQQVTYGIAVRMAVMAITISANSSSEAGKTA